VTVTVPAGALAADTTLTLTIADKAGYPNAADIASPVFDFGPDGTTFLKPVTMKLDFTGTPPSGKAAQIAWLDSGAWTTLADSAATSSQVTATTTHFTPFTVLFGGTGQSAGQCSAITACGGDPTGVWTYSAGCMTLAAASNPFASQCPAATATATLDVIGTVDFSAGNYSTSGGSQTITMTIDAPKSCFAGACPSSSPPFTWTDAGTSCKGVMAQGPTAVTESGTYSINGNTLTINKTSPSASTASGDFCVVSANEMVVRLVDPDGNTIGYTLTK
jgi:hypothetical protein